MSEQQLVATVHVRDLQGRPRAFGPGDAVPAWAIRQITNPKAWRDTQATAPDDSGGDQTTGAEPPPRSGRGSGVEAWREFAERRGIDVDQDSTREDVIAACEAAGVIDREE